MRKGKKNKKEDLRHLVRPRKRLAKARIPRAHDDLRWRPSEWPFDRTEMNKGTKSDSSETRQNGCWESLDMSQ